MTSYEPQPRWGHTSVTIGDRVFMWGGRIDDFSESAKKDVSEENAVCVCVCVMKVAGNRWMYSWRGNFDSFQFGMTLHVPGIGA